MGKKKGAIAAKARARREANTRSNRSPSPQGGAADPSAGPIVPPDGQRVRRGLQNLGNTCFMNSVIQCLNVSVPFSDELMGLLVQGLDGIPRSLCTVFRGIRGGEGSSGANKGAFNPKPLREELISKFPWYRGKEQQDAHELLRTLLGSISDETTKAERKQVKEAGGKPAGDAGSCGECVSRSFRGHICGATLCWGCGKVSLRLDPFMDVQLELPSLAGQAVGALGVTPAMLATSSGGKPDEGAKNGRQLLGRATAAGAGSSKPQSKPKKKKPSPAEDAEESGGERGGSKAERRRQRGKARLGEIVGVGAPSRPNPKGIWATRSEEQEREELLQTTRLLVARLVVRALEKQCPAEGGEEDEGESEEEEPVVTEIELTRQSRKLQPNWGFKWSEAKLEEGLFVLAGVKEDSVLEKWNLKCRAIGDDELIICVGDQLLEVNEVSDMAEVRKTLRHEDRVRLKFARGRGAKGSDDLGGSREETDQEAERMALAREVLRQDFCDTAARRHKELPEPLREIFGPEKAPEGSNGHLGLEDCLRRFSVVEALEDDFKPTYSCSECSKPGERTRTYASRRMWLWQADLPPLLTLHLKRFRRYLSRFEKSTASIALPTVVDLGDYVLSESQMDSMRPYLAGGGDLPERLKSPGTTEGGGPKLRYELYGICVHQGSTMASGHYVAYVNGGASLQRESWFGISDTQVWSCTRAEVLKAEAYIAFYRHEGSGEALAALAAARAAAAKASAEEQAEGEEAEDPPAASPEGDEAEDEDEEGA